MWYILTILLSIFLGVFDGHSSSAAALLFISFFGGLSVSSIKDSSGKSYGSKVFGIVFIVYTISAYIASRSFLNGNYYYVVDSMKYIQTYSSINSWSWSYVLGDLKGTYFMFLDNNGLFNHSISLWSYIANHYFDGASEYYLTLFLTLFGILASLEIYKIFSLYFEHEKAAKYSVIFAILSLFHIYSIVIIRDIVIAYFYMLGLRKVMGTPKLSDIFVLLVVVIVTMGVRLYTGLFFGAFVMFWLYKIFKDTKYARYRIIIVPVILTGVLFVVSAFVSSILMDSTQGQIEEYDELYSGNIGFVAKLRSLPGGIRHVAILFFSQLPLTKINELMMVDSFSQWYMSVLVILYSIFGFVLYYGLIYYIFFKGLFKEMNFNEKWIFIIMVVFIALTLSTHIDLRRSMEAIPIFYLFYKYYSEKYYSDIKLKVGRYLVIFGIILMFSYTVLA